VKRIPITDFILLLAIVISPDVYSQIIDSTSFKMNSRLSFYSFENEAEMILEIPALLRSSEMSMKLTLDGMIVNELTYLPGKRLLRIPFKITVPAGRYIAKANIIIKGREDNSNYSASAAFIILDYKPNEVKTDRLTGGLIVNKRQFFPFGFYCYSPVYPTLPEEEVVKGFNMISPYQRILPETFGERKEYMDRCAELGMKVHYNVLSVSGGGGVSSVINGITEKQKKKILIDEIIAFRDHPALLAWYIADEPTLHNTSPEMLEDTYRTIREYDPWHPVTIVFMAPFMVAKQYADVLDIVMADPYPVPDMPVTIVGNITGQLSSEFAGKKPVWIVPQAFGGGELWGREPSFQELRSMTYQAIIKGARGIQYFIRQGLNFFPKSTAAWGECGKMAVELAELTPWILSVEETIPVRSASQDIIVTSAVHDNQLLILAVNKTNAPKRTEYSVSGGQSGRAKVIFENRSLNVSGGYFSDQLSAFGSQAYLIELKPRRDTIKPYPGNLTTDPGFEDISSPGVPSACYARNGGDRGATYFLDPREHVEGNHSVRLITPDEDRGVRLRFFPVNVMNGKKYLISVWAKTDTEQRSFGAGNGKPKEFEITFGEGGSTSFQLENNWKQFVTIVTIPYDNDQAEKTNVILQLKSPGVAWFDMLQVIECYDIRQSINPELSYDWDF
jgi:hypothetical protein